MSELTTNSIPDWWIFRGPKSLNDLPPPPSWRQFGAEAKQARGENFEATDNEIELVNAALYLRRPLLITGKPGSGKTSLTYAVAHELGLGSVLRWSITTQSTLRDGLYRYDAIARLQDTSLNKDGNQLPPPIGDYLRLGPLGTAFAANSIPRVLLIDEIDKSDIDLPNDLLHIFEEGEFEIPELARLPKSQATVKILPYDAPIDADVERDGFAIDRGRVCCTHFPLVVMTSNGERDFPPAFLRRCLQLEMKPPQKDKLIRIVKSHLKLSDEEIVKLDGLIENFLDRRNKQKADLATDQLLNAAFLVLKDIDPQHIHADKDALIETLWHSLG
ncbi:MoxR family ATPase [Methylomonas sp. MV1]|uniref:AAA family ATPase n=1 Tax=Methylomonas sp. MV1 TaxID=3073620 RepID=UPI0028A56774|nr:MoxR family ATPase [Methylomonas sp. MV1]MDT4328925.1 MoxR family ATPase [Methylomonas sp. MV1]